MRSRDVSCFVLVVAALAACVDPQPQAAESTDNKPSAQRANPAAENCLQRGGTVKIEKGPSGGEYGVCLFEDNRQCEEWALLRGRCPVGGVRVTGYVTDAGRYCAITGGRYSPTAYNGQPEELGTCVLPDGKACDADQYFAGTCGR